MRTQKQWENYNYPKVLLEFTPRLREDVQTYSSKVKVPEYGSYYISGPTNTGKSTLAGSMYIEARKKQYFDRLPGSYLFLSAYSFFVELKKSFEDHTEDEHAVLAKYSNAQYLVIDDLGSTKFTEWGTSVLQMLINNRYENLLTTVITSNLSLDDLGTALGDQRTTSRIRRMCKLLKTK